ncbi:ANR family transcriptional regulator [Providencia rettgeri]
MSLLTFIHCATLASQAEQLGRYAQAHQHWKEAAPLARKAENRTWAQQRADFCLKAPVIQGGQCVKNDRKAI